MMLCSTYANAVQASVQAFARAVQAFARLCKHVFWAFGALSLIALAGCQTKALTGPCDVLVPINPLPATNSYLVKQDRKTAEQIAKHRGRYQQYRCG